MAQTIDLYVAALKEMVLPYIRNNFPKQTIALDNMKRDANVEVMNDEFIAPIYTSRHGGVGALANDGSNVNSGSGRRMTRGTVSSQDLYASFDISKKTMDASNSDMKAVENALTAQTKTVVDDFARQVNRMTYGDGVGVVAQVSGSNGANNVEVMQPNASLDDGRSIDWYGTINGDISPTKYLAVDQIIGIGTAGADLGTITAVNGGTSVTTTGSPAFATNDAVYIVDGSGAGAGTSEPAGFRAALSSDTAGSYAGVGRSTYSWTPQFGSVSEALTLERMQSQYISAREYAARDDKYIILVNKTLYNKYGSILSAMRRTVNETDLIGGWKGLEFVAGGGVVGVFVDYDVPDGEVLLINLDTWALCQIGEMDWLNGGGGDSLLRLQNTILYQATLVWFMNYFCLSPAANARDTRKTD